MASKITNLWSSQLVEASNYIINAGEEVHLLTSAVVDNSSGTSYSSLKVVIQYEDLLPDAPGASFHIGAVVEGKDASGSYYPLMYQFSPFNYSDQGLKRILIMQPNMDTFNLGIDDIVYPVNRTIARISREQGFVPESDFRVCILLVDSNPQGAAPFVSVKITGEAEQYNV